MGIEIQTSDDESDVEGEVDLEDELTRALEKLEKCRRRKKYLKGQLPKYQEEHKLKEEGNQESSEIIVDLKDQLQEGKNIKDYMNYRSGRKIKCSKDLKKKLSTFRRILMRNMFNEKLTIDQ